MGFHFDPFGMDDMMYTQYAAPVMFDRFGRGYQPFPQNWYRESFYPSYYPVYDDYYSCYPSRQPQNRRQTSKDRRRETPVDLPRQQTREPVHEVPVTTHRDDEMRGEPSQHARRFGNGNRRSHPPDKKFCSEAEKKSDETVDKLVPNSMQEDDDMEEESISQQLNRNSSEKSGRKSAPSTKCAKFREPMSDVLRTEPIATPAVGIVHPQTVKQEDCNEEKTPTDETEHHNKTVTKSLERTPQLYKKLKENEAQLDTLKLRVDAFTAKSKDKEYVYIDEMLTKVLLSLDAIETDGIEEIRAARKKLVQRVQEMVAVLENKAKSNDAEDVSKPAADEQSESTEMSVDENVG